MYKVFRKQKWILISNSKEFQGVETECIRFENPNEEEVKSAAKAFFEDEGNNLALIGNEEAIWEAFESEFTPIGAAGGLVYNSESKLLMIQRLGHADLPKGKIEIGEGTKEAALREVEEETGVNGLSILEGPVLTHHIYPRKGKEYLKTTYWYVMKTDFSDELIPQTEEDIEKVYWADKSEMQAGLMLTYPTLYELIQEEISKYPRRF